MGYILSAVSGWRKMQKEFNSTIKSADEPAALKPLGVPPEDVVCVIRLRGNQRTEVVEPMTGLTAFFRRVFRRPPWRMVAASGSTLPRDEVLPVDYSTIPEVIAAIGQMKEQLSDVLGPSLSKIDRDDADKIRRVTHNREVTEEIWLGRRDEFEPARLGFDRQVPVEGAKPLHLKAQAITAENLAAGLQPFYTRDAHAWNALCFGKAVEESTVLQTTIKVSKPLRLAK
jgi:hypothetical protein